MNAPAEVKVQHKIDQLVFKTLPVLPWLWLLVCTQSKPPPTLILTLGSHQWHRHWCHRCHHGQGQGACPIDIVFPIFGQQTHLLWGVRQEFGHDFPASQVGGSI